MSSNPSPHDPEQAQRAANIRTGLVRAWVDRRQAQGWKPGSATHAKMQLEFFMGAWKALELAGYPSINAFGLTLLAIGRDAEEVFGAAA